jgi:hypothetical protein
MDHALQSATLTPTTGLGHLHSDHVYSSARPSSLASNETFAVPLTLPTEKPKLFWVFQHQTYQEV